MKINFEKMGGLVPVIIQNNETREVLMLGFMNEEAYQKTLSTGTVWFWSRTRNKLWHKGETSGNYQKVKKILTDCDQDTILVLVDPVGGVTCHTGKASCFFNEI